MVALAIDIPSCLFGSVEVDVKQQLVCPKKRVDIVYDVDVLWRSRMEENLGSASGRLVGRIRPAPRTEGLN